MRCETCGRRINKNPFRVPRLTLCEGKIVSFEYVTYCCGKHLMQDINKRLEAALH
jgi:hypothetical protein